MSANSDAAAVRQLGSLTFGVSDMDAWSEFAEQILGMEARPRVDGEPLMLRMDEREARVFLQEDDCNDLLSLGFEVDDEAALDQLCERLDRAGRAVKRGNTDDAEKRHVVGLAHTEDPSGTSIELSYGPLQIFEEPFRSPRPVSGFVTGDLGVGHAVVTVRDQAESLTFYRDALGMKVSDFIRMEPVPGLKMDLTFLHCNPRHHTLALLPTPGGNRMHHFMVQLGELDDVGRAYQLCQDRKLPIASTLGRHTNDHMVSFYVCTPAGFQVEIGWGAREVDDATWRVQTHRSASIWGHRPPEAPE